MIFKLLPRFFVAFFFCFFVSCDKESDDIGNGVLNTNLYTAKDTLLPVITENELTGAVETTNLPINSLGIYNDPIFGITTSSFVTQLELETENPIIGVNPKVTKVVLTIPYLRKQNADGTFEVDSIFGNTKIRLGVYESGYEMKGFTLNSGAIETQKFYSDDELKYGFKTGEPLNTTLDFLPNLNNVEVKDDNGVVTVLSPRISLDLNTSFFQDKIVKGSVDNKLFNNNVFKSYFKGLFFKPEIIGALPENEGTLMLLDFSKGQIAITYSEGEESARVSKTINLNLKGNTANFFQNQEIALKTNKIILKGGQGATADLNLLTESNLNFLRNKVVSKKWLITEANLIFNIDKELTSNTKQVSTRLYLYDSKNKSTLLDYSTDFTTSSDFRKNKLIFDGVLQRDSQKKASKYKFRITKHLDYVLKNDTINNVKMGLSVTNDIEMSSFTELKNKKKQIPVASIIYPFGTILEDMSVLNEKQIKLEIFYSTLKQ